MSTDFLNNFNTANRTRFSTKTRTSVVLLHHVVKCNASLMSHFSVVCVKLVRTERCIEERSKPIRKSVAPIELWWKLLPINSLCSSIRIFQVGLEFRSTEWEQLQLLRCGEEVVYDGRFCMFAKLQFTR